MRPSRSEPALVAPFDPARLVQGAKSRGKLPPPVRSEVILRSEHGGLAPSTPVARWAGALRVYAPPEPAEVAAQSPTNAEPAPAAPEPQASPSDVAVSPRDAERLSLGLPPSLLQTFSPAADRENDELGGRMRQLGLPQAPLLRDARSEAARMRRWQQEIVAKRLALAPGGIEGLMTEDEYNREVQSVADRADGIRVRQANFEALSEAQRARRELLADGGSPKKGNKSTRSPEEMRERIDAFKFARKVEPDLPPLEEIVSELEKEPEKDQSIVFSHSSSQYVRQCTRQARMEAEAARFSEAKAHQEEAARKAHERKAEKQAARRLAGEKACASKVVEGGGRAKGAPEGCLAHLHSLKAAWLTICAIGSFSHELHDDLRFSHMNPEEQNAYIDKTSGAKKGGALVQEAKQLRRSMLEPSFAQRKSLIACMLLKKLRIGRAKKNAKVVAGCLEAWQPALVFMIFKKIAGKVRLLQSFWRICRRQLRGARDKVSARWHALEGDIARREVVAEMRASKKKGPAMPLSPEAMVECKRVEKKDRLNFLTHELRALRYRLLPKLRVFEEEQARMKRKVNEHNELQDAYRVVGVETEEVPMFLFDPPAPSYMPRDEEIVDMIHRCRAHWANWTPIPQDPGGAWANRRAKSQNII